MGLIASQSKRMLPGLFLPNHHCTVVTRPCFRGDPSSKHPPVSAQTSRSPKIKTAFGRPQYAWLSVYRLSGARQLGLDRDFPWVGESQDGQNQGGLRFVTAIRYTSCSTATSFDFASVSGYHLRDGVRGRKRRSSELGNGSC